MTAQQPAIRIPAAITGCVLVAALVGLSAWPAGPRAQAARRLWVLREPDRLVEYDFATLAPSAPLNVPRALVDHPEFLSVNAKGQVLFVPATRVPEGGGEPGAPARRAWLWDGRDARTLPLERSTSRPRPPDGTISTETLSKPFLSAAGDSVVWFETVFEKTVDASGAERSVRTSARIWRTAMDGGQSQAIARLSSTGRCECTTGVCNETCPEWELWAPGGVVGSFFLVTRFVPGQIGTTYEESRVYRRSATLWASNVLLQPVERPLDASGTGEILLARVLDGGCCGWSNEGDDQLLLWRRGTTSIVYDERRRYGNDNYDVSFYAADARLSPGASLLAYTIASTARTPDAVRLAAEGKDDPGELARIRGALAELPAVELARLGPPLQPGAVIRRAALVGWMTERELLVAQDGQLVIYDTAGVRRKETGIRVRSAADAFLRRSDQ